MEDKYRSFSDLEKSESRGKDFQVRRVQRSGAMAVIAPHGGGIELGTSEVAEAIAADDFSFYAFEGIKSAGNLDLHITSTRFDEPCCVELVRTSQRAISVHGEDSKDRVVFLGGRDGVTLSRIRESLSSRGFRCEAPESALEGQNLANICNRTANRAGVQLELSEGLRHSFFESLYSRSGRGSKNGAVPSVRRRREGGRFSLGWQSSTLVGRHFLAIVDSLNSGRADFFAMFRLIVS